MVSILSSKQPAIFLLLFLVLHTAQSFSYPEEKVEEQIATWPSNMTFHETKTNAMLGETLLKRLYKRIENLETTIRLESSQMYDKLKNDIQKNFRKCDRQRRKAESLRMPNTTNSKDSKHQKRDKKRRKKDRKSMTEGDMYQNPNELY